MTLYHKLYTTIMQANFSNEEIEQLRDAFRYTFSWCIPTDELLQELKRYSPIVEIGAGSGYWAWEMQKVGINIKPYDNAADNDRAWTYIEWGCAGDIVPSVGKKNILIVCPQYRSEMAYKALTDRYFEGKYYVYIGTPKLAMNCGEKYVAYLSEHFKLIQDMEISNWPGDENRMLVYERKKKGPYSG